MKHINFLHILTKTTTKPCTTKFVQRRIENICRDQSVGDKLEFIFVIDCQKGLTKREQMIRHYSAKFNHSEAQCSNLRGCLHEKTRTGASFTLG